MRRGTPITILLLTSSLCAQEPAQDVDALVARLEKAHHPQGDPPPLDRFTASLVLESLGREESSVQVSVDVRFFLWRRKGRSDRSLIHTVVKEGDTPVEQGRDRNLSGYWQRLGGKTTNMQTKDMDARKAVLRHANLAGQLLRSLDPAALVGGLVGAVVGGPEQVRLGRNKKVSCVTVTGNSKRFPFQGLAGDGMPAVVTLWVEEDTGQLLQVRAVPLENGSTARPEQAELFQLLGYRLVDRVLVPERMVVFGMGKEGKMTANSKVKIAHLDLEPELDLEGMDRPR